MKAKGNIGIEGLDSIRIGDMRICDLPIAENAIARQQLPLAEDTDRQNKIAGIVAEYPSHKVSYLDSRIVECETNIVRIGQMKNEQATMISEYTSQITLCKFRDEEIANIKDYDIDKKEKIKALYKRFPPYKVDAMEQQIKQSNETIERGDGVIATEYKSIAELRELKGLCMQRDLKLGNLGAKVRMG